MASEEFYFDFDPRYFKIPKAIVEILNDVTFDNLTELSQLNELEGLTIIRYDGKQPLIFSPDDSKFSYLKTLGEIISSLDPSTYFKDLSRNFEFKGNGHLDFDDFDLFLVKIAKNLLLVIMVNDPSSKLFRTAQKYGDELYEIFYQYELHTKGETNEVTPESSNIHNFRNELTLLQRSNLQSKQEEKLKKIKAQSKDQLRDSLRDSLNKMKNK